MWMYLVLCCILQITASIRLVEIQVPERVSAGQAVGLSCVYDLEGDKLYNIKWYYDGVEFFRFVPSDKPSKLYFPVKGIQVDLERSGNGTVFIQDVKTNTSGRYSCEISADAPSFQTLQDGKIMAVEENPENPSRAGANPLVITPSFIVLLFFISFENIRKICLEICSCRKANSQPNSLALGTFNGKYTQHLVTKGNEGSLFCKRPGVAREWTEM